MNKIDKPVIFKPKLPIAISKELEQFGYIRSMEDFDSSCTIGRDKELEELIITLAEDKKSPILVGESGVGKTTIVEELLYRIQHNAVPNFLKEQVILEINPNELNAGCNIVGSLEEKMKQLMHFCVNNNILVFIDEIHTIYGAGTSSKNDNDIATMLRFYLDKFHLKVIGTTTKEEYDKYFANSSIKRRFEKLIVNEPDKETLYLILDNVVIDKAIKNNIFLDSINEKKNELFSILINATDKKNRVYDDVLNNPDLVLSIIDKAFAYAKVYDAVTIEIEHFIKALLNCERIYESSRNRFVSELEKLQGKKVSSKKKIITFPK